MPKEPWIILDETHLWPQSAEGAKLMKAENTMDEQNQTPFTGMSPALQAAFAEELRKEDPEGDPDFAALAAMKRIAARIEGGETGIHDPLNPSDQLSLCLAR